LYEDASHRGYPRTDEVDKFEQDAWDNYEHVEGNLYSTTFRNAFKLGYNKAKETLYTEEDMLNAFYDGWLSKDLIWKVAKKLFKESLKQPKKN
jgi:hypothetical protein